LNASNGSNSQMSLLSAQNNEAPKKRRLTLLDLHQRANQLAREMQLLFLAEESVRRLSDRHPSDSLASVATLKKQSSRNATVLNHENQTTTKTKSVTTKGGQQKGLESFFTKNQLFEPSVSPIFGKAVSIRSDSHYG
jgi:hypothetical protein